jgi:hypothetical protein
VLVVESVSYGAWFKRWCGDLERCHLGGKSAHASDHQIESFHDLLQISIPQEDTPHRSRRTYLPSGEILQYKILDVGVSVDRSREVLPADSNVNARA